MIPAQYTPLPNQPGSVLRPGEKPYAHLANGGAFQSFIDTKQQTLSAIGKAAKGQGSKDAALANIEDTLKRGGGLAIATLATLGLARRVFGVGEFLGFASWFGAMGLTPKIINSAVRLKTGVNLNQEYHSTYGETQPLFKDPNYLPLHVLPDDTMRKIARKLGIKSESESWRKDTEDRIRQISAQSRTSWMLVAGPATPVISGLTCDLLQDPATGLVNKAKLGFSRMMADKAQDPKALERHITSTVNQWVGELPESELSRWWKKFSRRMVQETGLDKTLSIRQVIDASREEIVENLLTHFERLGKESGDEVLDSALNNLQAYLGEQREYLNGLHEKTADFLAKQESRLPEAVARNVSYMETRTANALSTLNHYDAILTGLKDGSLNRKQLRVLMEKPVLPEVDKLIRQGETSLVRTLVGDESTYRKLRGMMEIRQYGRAFKLMGASPRDHLLIGLKDFMLRRLWRQRIPLALGGGLLVSTLAYVGLVVGKTPKPVKPAHAKQEAKPASHGGHFA